MFGDTRLSGVKDVATRLMTERGHQLGVLNSTREYIELQPVIGKPGDESISWVGPTQEQVEDFASELRPVAEKLTGVKVASTQRGTGVNAVYFVRVSLK